MPTTALLIHAGIADHTMWEPQRALLDAAGLRVVAPDLRGFGDAPLEPGPYSHVRDVEALLGDPAIIVGASLGGRVALELALHRPDLVEALVLVAPGLPGWTWSEQTESLWSAEDAAYEAGDFESAAEVCLEQWIDGPRRETGEVDPSLRHTVRQMVLRSYSQQASAGDAAEEKQILDPPIEDRLGEIACRTLVVSGDEDRDEMIAIAKHLATTIPDARLATIAGASHLPSLERPDLFNPLLLDYLRS